MHNQASVLVNDTLKFLWDFEIQTDNLISARRPNLGIVNKKKRTCWIMNFDHWVKLNENDKKKKKKKKKKVKYLDLARK